MTISFASRISVPSDTLINEVGGESVLLNLKNERYFGLDEVGTRMWLALTTAASIDAAYDVLLDEYDVDSKRLRQDICRLIGQLNEQGLIEVIQEGPVQNGTVQDRIVPDEGPGG